MLRPRAVAMFTVAWYRRRATVVRLSLRWRRIVWGLVRMDVLVVRCAPTSVAPVPILVPVSTPSTTTAMSVPQMRASYAPEHMPDRRSRFFAFIHHAGSWADRRPLALLTHDRRPAIDMSVQWIAKVCQCRSSRINAALVLFILRPKSHTGCIRSLGFHPSHLFVLRLFPQPL